MILKNIKILVNDIEYINESPYWNKDIEINSKYLDEHIVSNIIKNKNSIHKIDENLYSIHNSKISSIYFYANINDAGLNILAGVYGIVEYHDNKQVYITNATKKYDNTFSSAALKLYSWISKNSNFKYLMSDSIHSNESKRIWQNWLNDPIKYGISEIYLYDIKEKIKLHGNINEYWCSDTKCKNYRVIVKF
jgi:hypothetical protein